jgi:rod shape-determining protein MreD
LEIDNRKTLTILGCLLVAGFLQTTLVHVAPDWLARWLGYIDWLMLVTVYIALQRNPLQGMLTGAVAGAIHDAQSGMPAFGVAGLAYVAAAYVTYSITALVVVDNLLVRYVAVAASSLLNTGIRLVFYALLGLSLPVLAGGKTITANFVFTLLIHLIASTLLYILLDRIFLKGDDLRRRRTLARRRRL